MSNNNFEKAYTSSEMAQILDIGTSTLRKWCLSLEENGYQFSKDDYQRRLFIDRDIVALKHFKQLVQTGKMPLSKASNVVVPKFKDDAFSTSTPSVLDENENYKRSIERSSEVVNSLIDKLDEQNKFIEEQREFNKELMKRLDHYENHIEQRLQKRDEDLMKTLNGLQESKERKKGILGKIFGK